MAKKYSRDEFNTRLRQTLKRGKPIIIGGAGDGFTAKLEEKGGVDIIGIYNSGRFRHFGAGSLSGLLPIGRNQDMVMDYAPEVLSMVKHTPVIAGFCAQDSRTLWEYWFNTLASMGVSGFMNFPTVGLIDAGSHYRQNLEESGLGYSKEIEVLKIAHELGFFTIGYCFTPAEARMVAEAKVDMVACHVGLTAGGLIGAESVMTLDQSVKVTKELIAAARKVRPKGDFLAITHGDLSDPRRPTSWSAPKLSAALEPPASNEPVEPAVVRSQERPCR
jgi:predicted TIM-barrel enzyme